MKCPTDSLPSFLPGGKSVSSVRPRGTDVARRPCVKHVLTGLLSVLVAVAAWGCAAEPAPGLQNTPVPDAHLTAPLTLPASGEIKVAFLISPGAELVDFGGPWGVFEYVGLKNGDELRNPFTLYTVAVSRQPVEVSGGMSIVPKYTFADAPKPDLVVVPALDIDQLAPAALDWLRKVQQHTALTLSVCNGSLVLGEAGLLKGKRATAHHGGYGLLRGAAEHVTVVRGVRYVEDGKIATAGGLTSGMDLALRVVERYFGREVAKETAKKLEYQSTGWMHPESNVEFVQAQPIPKAGEALDPVCEIVVNQSTAPKTQFGGKTYYFNCTWCQGQFMKHPERFVK